MGLEFKKTGKRPVLEKCVSLINRVLGGGGGNEWQDYVRNIKMCRAFIKVFVK